MYLSELKGFKTKILDHAQIKEIKTLANKARADVIKMITESGSGHIGGSLSSIDIYMMLWLCANVVPESFGDPKRDRIVVSHGHTSAAVYSVLGNLGYFEVEESYLKFRKDGSIFEGHPGIKVPGVEWCSGSLGQGLSVGCGFALASKLKRQDYHVFVVMGDGEQAKGQIMEAREFAYKSRLGNLTTVVDYNGLQASGSLDKVMPQNLVGKYKAAGWRVIEIDGHDYSELYDALKESYREKDIPTLVLARTVMGKGVSFIENNYEYHGKVLTRKQCQQALNKLGYKGDKSRADLSGKLQEIKNRCQITESIEEKIMPGTPILYKPGQMVDCRTAFGEALHDIASANKGNEEVKIIALDCDLAESVKVQKFGNAFPENLIECGIQEHNAVTVAGALSKSGVLTFFADFGVFGIDETYGMHRMGDINYTSLKLVCTHCGLDVGEDGKTHQCIDYIGLIANLFGYKVIIPADANQIDRIIRYISTTPGNFVVAMGRSKIPILNKEREDVMFGRDYRFEYGKADWIGTGTDGVIITCGNMVYRAVRAQSKLKENGLSVGVLNLSCPLELDRKKIEKAAETGFIITYEDHHIRTGIGNIVGTFLAENGIKCKFKRLGITRYGVSGSPDYQYKIQSLDEDSLVDVVVKEIKRI